MFTKLDLETLLSMIMELTYALVLMFVVENQDNVQIFHYRKMLSQEQTMLELFTTEESVETQQISISSAILLTLSRVMEQLSTQTHQTQVKQLALRQQTSKLINVLMMELPLCSQQRNRSGLTSL
jgi:hypothetical protein